MAKSKGNDRYKVYAFMINPHTLILVSQDGAQLAQFEVPSDVEAKEKLTNEQLNQDIILAIKRSDYSTIWVDDPAGDPAVIEACKKMEQARADGMLADAMVKEDAPSAGSTAVEPAADAPKEEQPEIKDIRTPGMVFQILHEGVWVNAPGSILKLGDTCRFFPEQNPPDEKEWVLVADPEMITAAGEEPSDYLIKVTSKDVVLSEQPVEPQFSAPEKTKVIDVECPTTHSEEKIKKLVRNLQSLKAEAQADAADWRERIKTQEKALFEACNGKSYTQIECRIKEDWEAGVRRFIRPDTGEVALEQQIPYEERQLRMGIDEPQPAKSDTEATPGAPAEDNATNVTETPAEGVLSFEPEPPTDETKPAENETTEPETGDFPPPEETPETVEEPAV